ncbi:MAG: ATP-binding cassette domain-containing protein [Candidatus Omnitrophica bacterium]|nr:ATP-binding cassette domain-containing protein [Candidatus Omnitrophota bacterium]
MKQIVTFENVKLGYTNKIVVGVLDLKICSGDFLGIVGPNGSGKTTLLRSIMGLLKPRQGKVIRDKDLRFGYCMQRQFIDTIFPFTVFEIVMMGRTALIGPLRRPGLSDNDKVMEALNITGIRHLAKTPFYELSGGQKQRVLIARALSLEPNFLILDEPTTDLDIKAEREILDLIRILHERQNLTIALVTHELNEVINFAQRFIFLNNKNSYKIFAKGELNDALLSGIFETQIKLKEMDGQRVIF